MIYWLNTQTPNSSNVRQPTCDERLVYQAYTRNDDWWPKLRTYSFLYPGPAECPSKQQEAERDCQTAYYWHALPLYYNSRSAVATRLDYGADCLGHSVSSVIIIGYFKVQTVPHLKYIHLESCFVLCLFLYYSNYYWVLITHETYCYCDNAITVK